MNYDFKTPTTQQEITLKDRKKLEITGVKKIESLDSNQFLVNTNMGDLLVTGEELEMQQLDIERGILWISGYVNSFEYVESKTKSKKNSVLGKIFK